MNTAQKNSSLLDQIEHITSRTIITTLQHTAENVFTYIVGKTTKQIQADTIPMGFVNYDHIYVPREHGAYYYEGSYTAETANAVLMTPVSSHNNYYDLNTDAQRELWNALLASADIPDSNAEYTEIYAGNLSAEDMKEVIGLFGEEYLRSYPKVYYVSHGDEKVVSIKADEFHAEFDTSTQLKTMLDQKAMEIVHPGMSESEAVYAISAWICDHLEYINDINYGDYSVAYETGRATCKGYAQMFKEMCNYVGIPCEIELGDVEGKNHEWNSVEINGQWYWSDITLCDQTGNLTYLASDTLWNAHEDNADFYRS